jgi:hypothetical protein
MNAWKRLSLTASIVAVSWWCAGCGEAPSVDSKKPVPATANAAESGASQEKSEHDHSAWWCNEHGVPEEECGRCSAKLAAAFQKKGDWCKEHDRPDSQCFLCHPEKEAAFAARYEAKYGKQPPKPEPN